ncbi:hypothetical protein [Mesomycoplasma neurolyticum]|uniref:hypothetical protein n=1 Tax=Mesomycoplasma neurolyticum TaxID=2120 RepID=UPI00101D4F00|nr:hypothetical protein [Mesomycoplasma neurolyticum]
MLNFVNTRFFYPDNSCEYTYDWEFERYWIYERLKWDFYILKIENFIDNTKALNNYVKTINKQIKAGLIKDTWWGWIPKFPDRNKHTIIQVERTQEDRPVNVIFYPSEYFMFIYGNLIEKEQNFRKKNFLHCSWYFWL